MQIHVTRLTLYHVYMMNLVIQCGSGAVVVYSIALVVLSIVVGDSIQQSSLGSGVANPSGRLTGCWCLEGRGHDRSFVVHDIEIMINGHFQMRVCVPDYLWSRRAETWREPSHRWPWSSVLSLQVSVLQICLVITQPASNTEITTSSPCDMSRMGGITQPQCMYSSPKCVMWAVTSTNSQVLLLLRFCRYPILQPGYANLPDV